MPRSKKLSAYDSVLFISLCQKTIDAEEQGFFLPCQDKTSALNLRLDWYGFVNALDNAVEKLGRKDLQLNLEYCRRLRVTLRHGGLFFLDKRTLPEYKELRARIAKEAIVASTPPSMPSLEEIAKAISKSSNKSLENAGYAPTGDLKDLYVDKPPEIVERGPNEPMIPKPTSKKEHSK